MKKISAFKSKEGKRDVIEYYNSFLQNSTFSLEELYVDTEYGKTFIIAAGEKSSPPLVLLHGSAMNSVMWLKDIEKYSVTYRVYAIDMIGEPGKSEETQLPLEDDSYSKWLNEVFNGLTLDKASIIGISLGGWLGTKFAISYPEKVDKLLLISPSGIGPQRKSFLFKCIGHMIFGEKGMDKLYYKVNGNQPIPEKMLKYQKLIGKNFNNRTEIIPIFSDEDIKRLNMPTTLFVGLKDIMLHSDKTAKRLERLLPQAKINICPEAGHTIINLTDEINKFLNVKFS
ncbi:alpha/beta hydrolase [Clostridium sp. LP20]|uniref:alpha/beta fold hydrolase n=1 Tax=Clostridium sp. LP20 TaxID=3418665 RepID=UPI003EE586BF